MAGPQRGTPGPGGQNGTIDVKPSDLYRVSAGVAAQQTPMDRGAKTLLDELNRYPDAGGYGTAPQAFATSYAKVGNRFLEVWAKSVVGIGGAAVTDYRASTDPQLVARLVGELHELLALDLDESDYALAVAELGMEVDPPAPYAPSGWLAHLADRRAQSRAEYRPSS